MQYNYAAGPENPSTDQTHYGSTESGETQPHKYALSDIYEKTEDNLSISHEENVQRPTMTSQSVLLDGNETVPNSSEYTEQNSTKYANQYKEETRTSMQTDTDPPDTGFRADAGTDLPTGRASEASSVPTYTNVAVSVVILY